MPRTGTYSVLVGGRDCRSGFISRGDVADFLDRPNAHNRIIVRWSSPNVVRSLAGLGTCLANVLY